jgi:hypothetical protein
VQVESAQLSHQDHLPNDRGLPWPGAGVRTARYLPGLMQTAGDICLADRRYPAPVNLIFLHGVAASGKLTTARALESEVGYPVFHNHLVVDLLTTVFTFGTRPFVELREQFWLAVVEESAREGRSLVFTFSPEATVLPGFAGRVVAAVVQHGGVVCFVRLTVGQVEQERRVADQARREFHKISDVSALRRVQRLSAAAQSEQPPVDLEVDTDISSAAETARSIVSRFGLRTQKPHERYPASWVDHPPA